MKKDILIISNMKGGKKMKVKKGLVLIALLVVMVCSNDVEDDFFRPGDMWDGSYNIGDDLVHEQL